MKKICIILVIFLLISGCSNEYGTWKKISISNVGTLNIPPEWNYQEDDNIIYFTDNERNLNDCKIYLIGIICAENQIESLYQYVGEKVEYIRLISSETLSNSAIIGKNEYSINDKICKKAFLDIYSSNKQLYIIVLDDSIEYEIIKKIGKSFKMCVEE